MTTTPEPIVLKCSCCGLPFATIYGGLLSITSRHFGHLHTNVIPLLDVTIVLKTDEKVDVEAAAV